MNKDKKILVVEDSILNQKTTRALIESSGFSTDIANNGIEAVQIIREGKEFGIILMDCLMPNMDGFQATQSIRALEKAANRYTPIIGVAATTITGDCERCLKVGMDDYLTKPLNRKTLSIKIDYWSNNEIVAKNRALADFYTISSPSLSRLLRPVDVRALSMLYGNTDLSEVLELFASSIRRLMKELQAAMTSRDAASTIRIAQDLSTCGITIGAREVTKLALFLDHAAGERDWPEVERAAYDIDVAVQQVEQYIGNQLSAA